MRIAIGTLYNSDILPLNCGIPLFPYLQTSLLIYQGTRCTQDVGASSVVSCLITENGLWGLAWCRAPFPLVLLKQILHHTHRRPIIHLANGVHKVASLQREITIANDEKPN
jgi:hypothetical protein